MARIKRISVPWYRELRIKESSFRLASSKNRCIIIDKIGDILTSRYKSQLIFAQNFDSPEKNTRHKNSEYLESVSHKQSFKTTTTKHLWK